MYYYPDDFIKIYEKLNTGGGYIHILSGSVLLKLIPLIFEYSNKKHIM